MGTTWLGVDEPSTIDARLGMELIGYGTTNVLAEHVVLSGTASNQFAQFATADPATNIIAPVVRVAGNLTVTPGGIVTPGATAGTSAMLAAGADGGTSNATVRTFNINASRELLVVGSVTPTTGGLGGSTASPLHAAVAPNLAQLYHGTTALAPQYSSIQVTASGIAAIVASAAGAIYVLAAQLGAKSTCTIQWFEGTVSGLTGVQPVGADGGYVLPFSPVGWFRTASGLPLSLGVQGSTGGVGGSLVWARPAS